MTRFIAVLLVAVGFAGVAVALGFLYKDYSRREGAWVDLQSRRGEISEADRRAILQAWEGPDHFTPALLAGSVGAAALGAGFLLAFFELPLMRPRTGLRSPSEQTA